MDPTQLIIILVMIQLFSVQKELKVKCLGMGGFCNLFTITVVPMSMELKLKSSSDDPNAYNLVPL